MLRLAGARGSTENLTTKREALNAAPWSIKGIDGDVDPQTQRGWQTELAAKQVLEVSGPLVLRRVCRGEVGARFISIKEVSLLLYK